MKLGAKLPNSGALPGELGIPHMARALEEAGFDSVWVSDHTVMPRHVASRYPFSADGKIVWSTETPYIDAMIALGLAAAVTERVRLGTAVLVLPLRHPVECAKQLASIDVVSGGRLALGVGAGWLREEFDALNVPFEDRGGRLAEWIAILRDCWTGEPRAFTSDRYALPAETLCYPRPVSEVPFLMGGHTAIALRRAGRLADGWLAQQSLDELDADELRAGMGIIRATAEEADRDPGQLRLVLRILGTAGRSDELLSAIAQLETAGVDEVIIDIDWDTERPAAVASRLASVM